MYINLCAEEDVEKFVVQLRSDLHHVVKDMTCVVM